MGSEKDPLLPITTGTDRKEDTPPPVLACKNRRQEEHLRWLPYRLLCILFVTGCSYFSIWMSGYACTEWMQDKAKRQVFSNGSDAFNLSLCGAFNKSDPVYRDHQRVQQITAKWQMYNTMAVKGVSLFTTVVFAVYTDVFGRRFMFILSTISVFINFILIAFVIYYDMDFEYLVGANAIYGLSGTSYGLLSVSYSAIADMTPDKLERSFGIFLNDVCIGISGTLGSLAVGYYIHRYGFVYPAFTATAIQVLVIFVTIFFIKESLHAKDRIEAPPIQHIFLKPFVFYSSADFKGSRSLFLTLLFAFVFTDMTGVHRKSMETLYQLAEPFCWSSSRIGVYSTIFATCENVFGVASFKLLQRKFSDITIAMVSEIANASSFIIEGLATNSLMLYMAIVPGMLKGMCSPLIRGTMSKMVSKGQQGALFASILVVQTIASFLTGISDNAIYAETLTIFNGLFFFVLAGYCVIALIFLVIFRLLLKHTLPAQFEEEKGEIPDTATPPAINEVDKRNQVTNSTANSC